MPGDRLQLAKTQPSSEHIQLHREDAHPRLVPQPAQPQQVPPAAQPGTEKVSSPKQEVTGGHVLEEACDYFTFSLMQYKTQTWLNQIIYSHWVTYNYFVSFWNYSQMNAIKGSFCHFYNSKMDLIQILVIFCQK